METRDKYIGFINMILRKPGMFLVSKVEDIWVMSFAYQYAIGSDEAQIISTLMENFEIHLNEKFKLGEKFSWFKLVRLYSGSDSHSLELFGKVFTEYLEEKVK